MKDRIFQIMKQQGLNQKDFAATTGISPATLSSIFNGRTSPTLNHAELLHKRFPNLSMSWLMFGEGDMFEKNVSGENSAEDKERQPDNGFMIKSPDMFSSDYPTSSSEQPSMSAGASENLVANSATPYVREVVKYIDKPARRITEIRIFFDDGTFETFPGK